MTQPSGVYPERGVNSTLEELHKTAVNKKTKLNPAIEIKDISERNNSGDMGDNKAFTLR